MPDWIIFFPLFLPILGTLALATAEPRLALPIRPWLAIALFALEILAVIINLAPGTQRVLVSDWELGAFSIGLLLDGVSILLLLTLFATRIALWLVVPPRIPFDLPSTFVLTSALFLFVPLEPTTIYIAWGLMDLAIVVWRHTRNVERETAMRGLVVGLLADTLLFAGTILIPTPSANVGAVLVALALWARLGLFPFQWVLPMQSSDSRDLWLLRGVPWLAGASLWLRWSVFRVDAPGEWIGIVAFLALFAAAVWIWREEEPTRAAVVATTASIALVPVAIGTGARDAVAFALWLTLGTFFTLALFELAQRWRAENRNRWSRLIWMTGIIALSGLPLTPTFVGRVGLYISLWENGQGWLPFAIALLTTALLSPMWNFAFVMHGAELRDPNRVEYAGLLVMVLAFLVVSIIPLPIAHALGSNVGDSAEAAMVRVVWTSDVLGVAIGLALVILPLFLSYFLRGAAASIRVRPNAPLPRALDLEWLEHATVGVGYQMGATARNLSAIVEENPIVWILLVALWIAIFVLIPR